MSQYESQYRNYYNNSLGKQTDKRGYLKSRSCSQDKSISGNKILKKIINQVIGTLIIALFILSMKVIPTNMTHNVYKYGKDVIKQDFDYKYYVNKAKNFNMSKTVEYINNADISKYFDISTLKNTFDFDMKKYFLFLDNKEFEGI